MLSYQEFREGTKGRIIEALTTRPEAVAEMQRLSRQRLPAVVAIDREIIDEVGRLDDTERQHTGRLVRDTLMPLGWYPTGRKRLRGGHIFTSGASTAKRPPCAGDYLLQRRDLRATALRRHARSSCRRDATPAHRWILSTRF